MTKRDLNPQRIQQAMVCMLFDPRYEALVRSEQPLDELNPDERALLRHQDPRSLRTDPMRRPRALQAILEEYPVSAALLGLPQVDQFFASPIFRAVIRKRGSMAIAFAEFLGKRARGVGMIEAAIARTRRPAPPQPGLGCSPLFVPLIVPRGTLDWYQKALLRLGPRPLRSLAKLPRPWRKRPPKGGAEYLLIEGKSDGQTALGGASEGLVRLLLAASRPRPRAEIAAAARRLGAEADEADELLDELLNDGLLTQHGGTS
ncbi:MAG TPA: hypothetical protein ENK31_10265 [Nannocystis exedens]|nr:hypothetical protein [Nannocystis exedens]